MYVPTAFPIALLMMVISMICWGSWANTYKLTQGYRFELFYWDYAIGIFVISVILALTLGSMGSTPEGFLLNVRQADPSNVAYAMVGGVIFNVANLLLVAGIEFVGLAVAFPVAIGIALVVGVVLSYAVQQTGDPLLLGLGVFLAIVAVIMDGQAYAKMSAQRQVVPRRGIMVCVVSGVLMGLFAPLVTRALTAGQPLGPYSIAVFFTSGALLSCFVVNVYFMRHPIAGEPVTFGDYLSARPVDHGLGILGGAVWGLGTVLNFVAASLVGVAIAYAIGQAAPMVAAAWGVFVWNEFRGAPKSSRLYLGAMFVLYFLAIVVISQAYLAA
jgi:glucose uptake protein